jgi:hypothetical protein
VIECFSCIERLVTRSDRMTLRASCLPKARKLPDRISLAEAPTIILVTSTSVAFIMTTTSPAHIYIIIREFSRPPPDAPMSSSIYNTHKLTPIVVSAHHKLFEARTRLAASSANIMTGFAIYRNLLEPTIDNKVVKGGAFIEAGNMKVKLNDAYVL